MNGIILVALELAVKTLMKKLPDIFHPHFFLRRGHRRLQNDFRFRWIACNLPHSQRSVEVNRKKAIGVELEMKSAHEREGARNDNEQFLGVSARDADHLVLAAGNQNAAERDGARCLETANGEAVVAGEEADFREKFCQCVAAARWICGRDCCLPRELLQVGVGCGEGSDDSFLFVCCCCCCVAVEIIERVVVLIKRIGVVVGSSSGRLLLFLF